MATSKWLASGATRLGDRHSLAGTWNGPVYRGKQGRTFWLTFLDDGTPVFHFATDREPQWVALGQVGERFEFTQATGRTRVVATLIELSIDADGFRHVLRLDRVDRLAGLDFQMTATITTVGYLELDEVMSVEESVLTIGTISRGGTPLPQIAEPATVWTGVLLRD